MQISSEQDFTRTKLFLWDQEHARTWSTAFIYKTPAHSRLGPENTTGTKLCPPPLHPPDQQTRSAISLRVAPRLAHLPRVCPCMCVCEEPSQQPAPALPEALLCWLRAQCRDGGVRTRRDRKLGRDRGDRVNVNIYFKTTIVHLRS